jgi:hypothetical protein
LLLKSSTPSIERVQRVIYSFFSALLLTGASVELRQNQPRGLVIEAEIAQAFAVVVLIFFGAIKIDLMQNDYFGMTPLPGKIMTYAVCSLSAAISSTIITTFAFWRTTGQMINADNG